MDLDNLIGEIYQSQLVLYLAKHYPIRFYLGEL